ncbi:MAG: hypothetical protein KAW87_02865 [Candidatus Cloacimonetes bacterium]|nr:hypothetical protein [Candidatus Cloacimonadota bacterium]
MRRELIFIVLCLMILLSFGYISNLLANSDQSHPCEEPKCNKEKNVVGLEIVNFTEDSNLQKAGAKIGDIIIKYNGEEVDCIKGLNALKKSVETSEVEIVLKRGEDEIKFTIPKGQIGVYLKEFVPDHKIDENAVIIEDIGQLGWSIGMENSFLGAVYRINEKFGQEVSYEDIVGLSGYAFRLQFFDGWCPSSPDATCGKDVGSEILKLLGYKFEIYHMKTEFMNEEMVKSAINEGEIRQIMMKSIDSGWPVIAIDLIEIPEWGLVTGYQKDGKEFFCRTYFDKTKGYEIAQKVPWAIFVITDKGDVDITPQYKNSLLLAQKLYNTEKFDNYFSGIKAIQEWIKDLQDEKYFTEIGDTQFEETNLANWWIYYCLLDTRNIATNYLSENINKFDVNEDLINEIIEKYKNEVEILQNGFKNVPSQEMVQSGMKWDNELRNKQIDTLNEFLEIEIEVSNIIEKIK